MFKIASVCRSACLSACLSTSMGGFASQTFYRWVSGFLHSCRSGGKGGGGGGRGAYKLLTGIYELIVSDCKHNNSFPVSACLLMEGEKETDRRNRNGREDRGGGGGGGG